MVRFSGAIPNGQKRPLDKQPYVLLRRVQLSAAKSSITARNAAQYGVLSSQPNSNRQPENLAKWPGSDSMSDVAQLPSHSFASQDPSPGIDQDHVAICQPSLFIQESIDAPLKPLGFSNSSIQRKRETQARLVCCRHVTSRTPVSRRASAFRKFAVERSHVIGDAPKRRDS